jgi:hypothetical protein
VVSRRALLALGAAARGERPADEAAELSGQGVLGADGRLSDAVAPTAVAVGFPSATLRVTAARPEGTRAADLWLGGGRAVLHPDAGAPAPVVSVSRSLLPQLLVRATGLGPRPAPEGPPFAADGATVAAAVGGRVPAPWTGNADRASLWRVEWRETEGGTGVLSVLDLGSLGYWRPTADRDGALTWSPSTGAAVWEALGALFAVTLEDRLPT